MAAYAETEIPDVAWGNHVPRTEIFYAAVLASAPAPATDHATSTSSQPALGAR